MKPTYSISNIKNLISGIQYVLLLMLLICSSCNDWLDGALPQDRNLASQQFSSERGIHAVLNGLYDNLASNDLYGGRLTTTDIELLANYYYYEHNISTNQYAAYTTFKHISEYQWAEPAVSNALTAIWNSAYRTIFEINTFIESMSTLPSGIIPEERKNVYMGEAYGMRAYIHFDIWRLFGFDNQNIPYNQSADVTPHTRIPMNSFFELLLKDIERAAELLQNDPILTQGVMDLNAAANAAASSSDIFYYYMRNYRMNYYAVQALKARIIMYRGSVTNNLLDIREASNIATTILEQTQNNNEVNLFRWASPNIEELNDSRDYIFYNEIIFGIFNPDLHTRWIERTIGSSIGRIYSVHLNHLENNIFSASGNIRQWEDVRSRQWQQSAISSLIDRQYASCKFENFGYSENNPRTNFQPLMRASELHYIRAERFLREGNAEDAMIILNNIRERRGTQASSITDDPQTTTLARANAILEAEQYKEFYGEGQIYFFLKRRNSDQIFDRNGSGSRLELPERAFRPPLPERELSN